MFEVTNELRSQILSEAMPYIQKYYKKIIVVKYGGNAMTDESLKNAVMSDIVLLSLVGIRVVLIHGGGPEITDMLGKIGKESRFVNGLRYTDEETADIVQMVLAGKVNKELVSHLTRHNGRALGFSGIDGELIRAKKMASDEDYGFVGEIEKINTEPIINCLDNGYIPVIATVACGEDGVVYNINADTAAAQIAANLG
ncbi:MAG: acetylglutamate kinase, partial [Ruminococcus sp.]|nr:acetylglutamate kinase [Ruminococcus sp.]